MIFSSVVSSSKTEAKSRSYFLRAKATSNMRSRLATTSVKLNRILLSGSRKQLPAQRLGCATSTGRTADPALHSVEPEEVDANAGIKDEKQRHLSENESTTKDDKSYVPQKSPLNSSPKLENPGIGPKTDPIGQQKRRNSTKAATIDDVSCAGIDGSPWPEDGRESDRKEQREEQMEDDREYFKHHKASMLSEIEIADTRKPITKATDGTVQNDALGYGAGGVITWRPEQLDSAEDSLRRAMEIFRENAMRGDPDSPHGRVLRQLRGENW